MNYYPEDIVNNMSLTELQNCDWDALFKQIQQPINNNYLYNNNSVITNNNLNTANDKAQDIVISRNPIFIPIIGANDFDSCGAIEIKNCFYLDSKIKDHSGKSKPTITERGIYDCKICDEPFQTRSSLLTHVKVHQQPFCSLCLTPFKSVSAYRTHYNKLHNTRWLKNKQESPPPPSPEVPIRKLRSASKPPVIIEEEKSIDDSSNDSIQSSSSTNSTKEIKKNSYNLYDNLSTVTMTSKYGRRRKVIDIMTTIVSKKYRKSK